MISPPMSANKGFAPLGVLVIFLIAVGIFIYVVYDADRKDRLSSEEEPKSEMVDTTGWNVFESETYGFRLRYPDGWRVASFPDHEIAPTFNIYPENIEESGPFTHHSDIPHVSVFPKGVPTEGIFGESKKSEVLFQEEALEMRDFVLVDGEVWATLAGLSFTDRPLTWTESGFIFARARIANLETICLRDGVPVSEEVCDPLFGDTIVREGNVDSFERAIERAILESFQFTQQAQRLSDLVRLRAPTEGEFIESPLIIRGEARGTWFFEATFPVGLTDWDGRIIAEHYAEAQGEWMTEDFVPFEAVLEFEKPDTTVSNRGAFILQRSNPSGLPEHDRALEIPIQFE